MPKDRQEASYKRSRNASTKRPRSSSFSPSTSKSSSAGINPAFRSIAEEYQAPTSFGVSNTRNDSRVSVVRTILAAASTTRELRIRHPKVTPHEALTFRVATDVDQVQGNKLPATNQASRTRHDNVNERGPFEEAKVVLSVPIPSNLATTGSLSVQSQSEYRSRPLPSATHIEIYTSKESNLLLESSQNLVLQASEPDESPKRSTRPPDSSSLSSSLSSFLTSGSEESRSSSTGSSHSTTACSELSTNTDISGLVSILEDDPIGYGGFCDLFLGRHKDFGRVAMKRPRVAHHEVSAIKRFCQEANLWCRLSHRNILPFLGTCKIGRNIYMVSPFVDNGDLLRCIQRGMILDRGAILYQIANAIAHLHQMDIIHGDIKAQNVLLSHDKSPLLCDFGLAKAFSSMVTSSEAKGRGSLRWMAPELFMGESRTTESDAYAFGMTIAEVLSGHPPYLEIPNNLAVMFQVMNMDIRPLRNPSEGPDGTSYHEFWEIAEKCWVRRVQDRPSMDQVSDLLRFSTHIAPPAFAHVELLAS